MITAALIVLLIIVSVITGVAITVAVIKKRYPRVGVAVTRPAVLTPPAAGAAAPAAASTVSWYRADKRIGKFAKDYPKIALFGVWTIFLYVAAIVLYPEAAFLLSPKWVGILLLLLAMVVILTLGVDILKSSWLTMVVFALLTVAVVDPGLIRNFPDEFKSLYRSAGFSSKCANKKLTPVTLNGTNWTDFNTDNCDTQFAVTEGVALLDGPGLGEPLRVPAGDMSKNLYAYAIYTRAKAEGSNAKFWHLECENGKAIAGKWQCK